MQLCFLYDLSWCGQNCDVDLWAVLHVQAVGTVISPSSCETSSPASTNAQSPGPKNLPTFDWFPQFKHTYRALLPSSMAALGMELQEGEVRRQQAWCNRNQQWDSPLLHQREQKPLFLPPDRHELSSSVGLALKPFTILMFCPVSQLLGNKDL